MATGGDAPAGGDHVLFAGRRWLVAAIDHGREEILVEPARGHKAPLFEPSRAVVHPRVREKMRAVLTGGEPVSYLNAAAAKMLAQARAAAREAGLAGRPLIDTSASSCLWFTWSGTKAQRTLATMAEMAELRPEDLDIEIQFRHPPIDVVSAFAEIRANPPPAIAVAGHWAAKRHRKYDGYITEGLLDLALSRSAVDIESALGLIESLTRAIPS